MSSFNKYDACLLSTCSMAIEPRSPNWHYAVPEKNQELCSHGAHIPEGQIDKHKVHAQDSSDHSKYSKKIK